MKIGIVGHEARKFDTRTIVLAQHEISEILKSASVLVSGGCHLGGIDIWAEEEADRMGIEKRIFLPKTRQWSGYRARNIQIAEESDVVYCIVVDKYPEDYNGMKFSHCYHCRTDKHIKSGGCWTARYAQGLGKQAIWRVIT